MDDLIRIIVTIGGPTFGIFLGYLGRQLRLQNQRLDTEMKRRDEEAVEVAGAKAQAAKVPSLEARLQTLEMEIIEQRGRDERQQSNFDKLMAMYESKTAEHALEKSERARLADENKRKSQELRLLTDQRDQLIAEIEQLKQQYAELNQKFSEWRALVEEASERANRAEAEHEQARKVNQELSIEIEVMRRSAAYLKANFPTLIPKTEED